MYLNGGAMSSKLLYIVAVIKGPPSATQVVCRPPLKWFVARPPSKECRPPMIVVECPFHMSHALAPCAIAAII